MALAPTTRPLSPSSNAPFAHNPSAYYVKHGNNFYLNDGGSMVLVTDPDTSKSLKAGKLPYRSEAIDRGLTFGGDSPQSQAQTTQRLNSGGIETPAGQGNDIDSLFKQKFMEALQGMTNSKVPALEARQRQIQTQMLTAPMPDTSKLDPNSILQAVGNRGKEYSGALDLATQAIGQEKSTAASNIQELNALASLYKQMSGGEIDTQVTEADGQKLLINSKTGETIKVLGASSVPGSNMNQISDNERALMSSFTSNPIVKNYNEIVSQKNYTDLIISNGVGGPGDLALVYTFMKGLDPTSVVRETEYDMAAKSGNIFAGWASKFNGYLKETGGFLPQSVQKEFQNLVNQKLKAQQVSYDNYARSIREIAERQGLNPDNVVPRFDLGVNSSTGSQAETKVINGSTYKKVPGGWQKIK